MYKKTITKLFVFSCFRLSQNLLIWFPIIYQCPRISVLDSEKGLKIPLSTSTEYEDVIVSREMLDMFIQEEIPDYEIIRVTGDGLCILRVFKECMEVATGKGIVMDYIKEKLRKEISDTYFL